MEILQGLDWWGIAAAAVAGYLVGAIWYQPAVFGTKWMAAQPHRKAPEDYQNAVPGMFVQFFATLLTAVLFAVVMGVLGALATALLLILAYLSASAAGAIFQGHQRTLWFINGGYEAVMLVVIGLVLSWAQTW